MGGPAIIDGEKHEETNNFQLCEFTVDGLVYSSAENYYQLVKATTVDDRNDLEH